MIDERFELRGPFGVVHIRAVAAPSASGAEQRSDLGQRTLLELRHGVESRSPHHVELALRLHRSLFDSSILRGPRAEPAPARDRLLRRVVQDLTRAFELGKLVAEVTPIASLTAQARPTIDAPPPSAPPPPTQSQTTFFEVRFVDEVGVPIGGLDLEFSAGTRNATVTTNPSGVALLENVTSFSATVSVADAEQLRRIIEPRTAEPRAGRAPSGANTREVSFAGKDFGPTALKPAVPNTVVVVPALGKLFVELFDKAGRVRHANQRYEITGPRSFSGTTDAEGRLLHERVLPGDFEIAFTVEIELKDGERLRQSLTSPLTVLAASDPLPQKLLLGELPFVALARVSGMLFDLNKKFLLPPALQSLARIREILEANDPSELLIVGHTDTSGEPSFNDQLSVERADSVAAFLQDEVQPWLDAYGAGVPANKRWGKGEDAQMLIALEIPGEGEEQVRNFQTSRGLQVDGVAGNETRTQLIREYMGLDGAELDSGQFDITVTTHGCGENFPLDESGTALDAAPADARRDPVDRRVELFFFDKQFGIQPPPPGKNSPKGSTQYPSWRRRADKILDDVITATVEVNLQLTFLDPEGNPRPFPGGVPVEVLIGSDFAAAPAGDPDAEPTPEQPRRTSPEGRVRFEVPRSAGSFGLRFALGENQCISADPRNLADQRFLEFADALAQVAEGRVFFQVPAQLDTRDGFWSAPGSDFQQGSFRGLVRLQQIGTPAAPAELRLEIRWLHFRFEFFDRFTRTVASVPQPRSRDQNGNPVPPLELDGFTERFEAGSGPIGSPEAGGVWDVQRGGQTLHCIGWTRRDLSGATPRELPDQQCLVRLLAPRDGVAFVRREGDGAANAPQNLVVFPNRFAAEPGATNAGRLRLYDLPDEWWSTAYPTRLAGQGLAELRKFEELPARASTADRPYVVDLDIIVLVDEDGDPEQGLVFDGRDENRFTIYDSQLDVHKPDTASGEIYFTRTNLDRAPDGPVMMDLPRDTRLIGRGQQLHHAFDERTRNQTRMAGLPVGARAARILGNIQGGFVRAQLAYTSRSADGTRSPRLNGGSTISGVLRCTGRDGNRERFAVFQYECVRFNFSAPPEANATVLPPPPPSVEEQRLASRNSILALLNRWNATVPRFDVDAPERASGTWRALLVRGGSALPVFDRVVVINVYQTIRARQGATVGSQERRDMLPDTDTDEYTGAHEYGHSLALPDEYFNTDDLPCLDQPHIAETSRSPGTPYGFDEAGMMGGGERLIRARYFWHLALFMQSEFDGVRGITVTHGSNRYRSELVRPEQSRERFPIHQAQNVEVGPRGLCDLFVYTMGQDGWINRDLPGGPFDGVIMVRVKLEWNFGTSTDLFTQREVLNQAQEVVRRGFNLDGRRLVARCTLDGRPLRLRVLFSARHISETFPSGTGASRYLAGLRPPLTTVNAYDNAVRNIVAANGVHATVRVRRNEAPSLTGTGTTARQAVVRFDDSILFIPLASFQDDFLALFSRLVGLVDEDQNEASDFNPLFFPLRPRLNVLSLELVS